MNDPLYFSRTALAERLLNSLSDGVAHAFTLFAPRRMGKTQFLLNDVRPAAEGRGFKVFYFSFMDVDNATIAVRFQQALMRFAAELTTKDKAKTILASIDKVAFMGASISRETEQVPLTISDILEVLAAAKSPILLLLDEAQELARGADTQGLIRSLRTGLDINKASIKVIFTGSSVAGLQALFNDSKAPFFHFAHNIEFPVLGREFSDHLARIIEERTKQTICRDDFFAAFERMHHTPLYLRAVAQDMILNPALTLEQALAERMRQLSDTGAYQALWESLNHLDRAVLLQLAAGESKIYSKGSLTKLTETTQKNVSTSQVQKAIERLNQKDLIARSLHGDWLIVEQAFRGWITTMQS